MTQPTPRIVSREEWLTARRAHLDDEKAFTRARDALSARRRELPAVRLEKDYQFQSSEGAVGLGDLFQGRKQLIVKHFMFGPNWAEGCPSCSFWADGYSGLEDHLAHRDTAFVAISNTSLENIDAYRDRMGWTFRWVSSLGTDFNRDFNVSFTEDELQTGTAVYNFAQKRFPSTEAPGLSVFLRGEDGSVAHTYSTYSRGLDMMNSAYHLLDLTPMGRNEDGLDYPMAWLRRRDQYED